MKVLVTQACPTLWDPVDWGPPGSSVRGILRNDTAVGCHASSRASSQPRDATQVSRIAGRFFTIWATQEALIRVLIFSAL